jgi:hypothetical protein
LTTINGPLARKAQPRGVRWFAIFLLLTGCGDGHDHEHDGHELGDGGAHVHDFAFGRSEPGDLTVVPGPMLLSQSGLYSDLRARTLATGVKPYAPRWPEWADGATQERFLFVPPGAAVDKGDPDGWVFPVGTKAWRNIAVRGRLVETRLLLKVYDNPGGWFAMGYLWDADGGEARAVPAGADDALGSGIKIPTVEECGLCHVTQRDVLIGVSALQLGEADAPGAGIVRDALGYLHGNCGHCHNPVAAANPKWPPMGLQLQVGIARPEDTAAYRTAIGARMFHPMEGGIDTGIVPGRPERSQLWVRMGLREDWGMPPLASRAVDPTGLATVRDWIRGLR